MIFVYIKRTHERSRQRIICRMIVGKLLFVFIIDIQSTICVCVNRALIIQRDTMSHLIICLVEIGRHLVCHLVCRRVIFHKQAIHTSCNNLTITNMGYEQKIVSWNFRIILFRKVTEIASIKTVEAKFCCDPNKSAVILCDRLRFIGHHSVISREMGKMSIFHSTGECRHSIHYQKSDNRR